MARGRSTAKLDLSSFMCVILMLIGVLMIMLIANVVTIISNPENVQISALIKGALYAEKGAEDEDRGLMLVPKFGNKLKEPTYIDVFSDHVIIYPDKTIVHVVDLERPGNAFERVLNRVAMNRNSQYIVLLARPRSARVLRRLRTAIRDREVDLGFELYEEGRTVDIAGVEMPSEAQEEVVPPAEPGVPTPQGVGTAPETAPTSPQPPATLPE